MIVAITVKRIAEAQAARPAFTLNDAADIIIAQAENSRRLGVTVDLFDLAGQVAVELGVGFRQELGIVQAVLRKTEVAA